jgi:hypothetical protein
MPKRYTVSCTRGQTGLCVGNFMIPVLVAVLLCKWRQAAKRIGTKRMKTNKCKSFTEFTER